MSLMIDFENIETRLAEKAESDEYKVLIDKIVLGLSRQMQMIMAMKIYLRGGWKRLLLLKTKTVCWSLGCLAPVIPQTLLMGCTGQMTTTTKPS